MSVVYINQKKKKKIQNNYININKSNIKSQKLSSSNTINKISVNIAIFSLFLMKINEKYIEKKRYSNTED